MVSTTICTKTVVLMLISAEVIIAPIFGAKILFISANFNSHVICLSRLAADLAQLGHVTRVLAPSNARAPEFVAEAESAGNFSYTTYRVDGEEPYANTRDVSAASFRLAASHSIWEKLILWSDILEDLSSHCESDCVRLLDNDHIMKQVRDEGYQFAVMDMLMVRCYYAIQYSLGIPYASLSVPVFPWAYRVPRFSSFTPSQVLAYSDRMSFVERLATFIFDTLLLLRFQNDTTTYVDRLAPDRPSINNIQLLQRVHFNNVYILFVN